MHSLTAKTAFMKALLLFGLLCLFSSHDTIKTATVYQKKQQYTPNYSDTTLTITCKAAKVAKKGVCDAILKPVIKGGTAPYRISWITTDGNSGSSFTNLCEGIYEITVTDFYGNSARCTVKVEKSGITPLVAKGSYYTDDDGITLTASIFSGNPPYTYWWSDGTTGFHVHSPKPGFYKVIVTDAYEQKDSCSFKVTKDTVIIVGCK